MACICAGNKPGELLKLFRKLNWRVYQRFCNHSAFNGYKRTVSDYSSVTCRKCGFSWRTKADYIYYLKDLK